jgi:hypothetical protein
MSACSRKARPVAAFLLALLGCGAHAATAGHQAQAGHFGGGRAGVQGHFVAQPGAGHWHGNGVQGFRGGGFHQGFRGDGFVHQDFNRFHHFDNFNHGGRFRDGRWFHGFHGGINGWWWVAGGAWTLYPAAVYPYPAVATGVYGEVLYWCAPLQAYYPNVVACPGTWQVIVPGAVPVY